MRTVRAECFHCHKEFDKRVADYNRTERQGKRHFCSRSCSRAEANRESPNNGGNVSHFKGRRGSKRDGYTPFRWFMLRANQRRSKKGETDLTLEYLKDLWDKQKGLCPFTGWSMILPSGSNGWKSASDRTKRASLDRIDCSRGYLKGNVRFVSVIANFARQDFSDDEVREFCRAVSGV